MGHSSGAPPVPGAAGGFSPAQAKKFFEFFAAGTHREVVFLGDLVEQPVHYVRSKGHKVLCGARVGVCQLCELAAHDADTSVQQVEFYAAAYVRTWRERDFHQRVAVFSDAAGRQLMQVMGGAGLRGRRVEVVRKSQGTSARFTIDQRDGNPAGFPATLPAAFDLVPFIRARYGRQQTADRPLVFLDPIRSEPVSTTAAARPRALNLTAEDCAPPEEVQGKLRNWLKSKSAEDATPDPTAAIPAVTGSAEPAPQTPVVTPRPATADESPTASTPATAGGIVGDLVARFRLTDDPLRVDGDIDQHIYGKRMPRGPKVSVYQPPAAEDDELALNKRVGEVVCGELKAKLNGKAHANGNGGGK